LNKEESIAYYSQLAVKAARDADAFTELYEYFFPRVYNFLFAKVQNTAVADDLVSMVFMKAYTNLPNYNQAKAAFSTWLFNIASHALTDYYRSSVNKKRRNGMIYLIRRPAPTLSRRRWPWPRK